MYVFLNKQDIASCATMMCCLNVHYIWHVFSYGWNSDTLRAQLAVRNEH